MTTTATIHHAEGVRFDNTLALDEDLMKQAALGPLYDGRAASLPGWNGPFVVDANDELLIADAASTGRVRYGSTTDIGHRWTRAATETIARHLVDGELVFEIVSEGQPYEYIVITPGHFDVREDF